MISFDNDFDGLLHDQSFEDQVNAHHQSFNDHRIFDRVTAPFKDFYIEICLHPTTPTTGESFNTWKT